MIFEEWLTWIARNKEWKYDYVLFYDKMFCLKYENQKFFIFIFFSVHIFKKFLLSNYMMHFQQLLLLISI